MITSITFIATKNRQRWTVMLLGWRKDDDDPSIEDENWASGDSAEEALAHATIQLGTHWQKLEEGGPVVAAR